jgi:hypothetical protein
VPRATTFLAAVVLGGACKAHRYLELTTTPPGADVRVDDEHVGQTPLEVPFEHYGTRRVTFYLSGYRTVSKQLELAPRWYARFPLDLVTEVILPLGLRDRRRYHEDLVPGEEVLSLPSLRSVIERAGVLREGGPEGPRALPEAGPAVVPSAPPAPEEPAPDPEPRP